MTDNMLVGPGLNIDFDAYFNRIEYSGSRRPTAETLRDLHVAHATHIPFENVDVMLREPQVPVHPKVARDLGVRWAHERTRYGVHGRQATWESYIRSYIEHYG